MSGYHVRIGKVLMTMQALSDREVSEALREQEKYRPQEHPLLGLPDLVRGGGAAASGRDRLLGEILLDKGVIGRDILRTALMRQWQLSLPICRLLKKEDMAAVVELLGFINSTINLDELLDRIMVAAREVLNAEASSLMLLDEQTGELIVSVPTGPKREELKEIRIPRGEGISGWVAEHGEPLLIPDVSEDSRFFRRIDQVFGFVTRSVVCMPLRAKGKTLGVLEVINRQDGKPFSGEDAELLMMFAHQAAVVLDNARLQAEALERERLMRELIIAKQIQERLIPKTFPEMDGLRMAGFLAPAEAVSGDFYDYMVTREGDLIIFIGDVSGKGIPASLLMATTSTALKILLEMETDLAAAIETVNRFLSRGESKKEFVTLFLGRYSPRGRTFHYVNCGHPPPILVHSCRQIELDKGGSALGAFPEERYSFTDVPLLPGDVIVMFTDGVTEIRDPGGALLGEERLEGICTGLRGMPAENILDHVRDRVLAFAEGAPQEDDLAMVVLQAI
jgi:sigma-B regulation protein RsbU (phosphoserine phosphatase)